jgi:HK97 family phage major capsid protein
MPFTTVISRTDVQALVPEDVTDILITDLASDSAAMRFFRRYDMPTNQTRIPVLSALPTAYFVQGDTGQKQTTEVNWSNKYLNAEELAAIVPMPENVADDINFNIWDRVQPLMVNAIGRALDVAIFFGTNKPSSWPAAIITDAATAGNTTTRNTAAANGGIAADLSNLYATVEADGYDVNGVVANPNLKAYLRNARDSTGQPFTDMADAMNSVFGAPVTYAMRGLWPTGTGTAQAFAGDWTQMIFGVRRDISWKLLDQAVIQDNTGAIIYNLAQQDMVAMRVTMRVAWQVANPLNYDQATDANRYGIGVLLNP